MDYFFISTDHLEDQIWFRDKEDFLTGMNYVAVVTELTHVRVLAFVLMSNHVHFVLESSRDEAMSFILEFKRLYSYYLSRKDGTKELLRRNGIDIQNVGLEKESLERSIAYVLMNPVAANIVLHPSEYPWGSGDAYFQMKERKGRLLGSMTTRSRRLLLHTKAMLPDNWILGDERQCIMPASFIQAGFVESLFRTPSRMNYFLNTSSKARRRLESGKGLPSFRDQVILAALPDLYHTLFQKREWNELTLEEQGEMSREVKRRFSADVGQLARVIGLSYSEMASCLDRASI